MERNLENEGKKEALCEKPREKQTDEQNGKQQKEDQVKNGRPKGQSKFKGYLLLAFTIMAFSTLEVVSAPMKGMINPLALTFLRFLLGGIFLLPFVLIKNEKIKLNDMAVFLLLGGLNVFVSMSCLQASVFFGKASTTAMLISSNPIFVMLFSIFILKEKLTWKNATAMGFGLIGLILISSRFSSGGDSLAGVSFGIFASLTFGLYTVLSRLKSDSVSSLSMITYSSLLGCLFYLPIFALKGINPFVVPQGHLISLVYMGVVLSGMAYVTYIEALKILGASKGSVTFFLKPAIASVLAVIFLGENLSKVAVAGSFVIIIGMAINFWPERKLKKY